MDRLVELGRDTADAAGALVDRALGFHLDLTAVLVAAVLATVLAVVSVLGEREGPPWLRALPRVALALVLVGILALTLQPRPATAEALNLTPLRSFDRYLADGVDLVLAVRNIGFNVVLFVPYGLVRAVQRAARDQRAVVTLVTLEALVLSVGIELVQYVAPLGRVADVDDVLTNVAGGLAGALAGTVLVGMVRAGGPRQRPAPSPAAR